VISLLLEVEGIALPVLLFLVAVLYACVGQAGATGYLAAMGVLGVSPEVMRPSALILNVLVASIGTYKYSNVGQFSSDLFFPIVIASVPFAFLGGALRISGQIYNVIVGAALVFAAWCFWRFSESRSTFEARLPSRWVLMAVSAPVGFMAGLTGIGGGVFIAPMLILLRWAPVAVIPGVSAAYILLNSIAGLVGVASTNSLIQALSPQLAIWALVVLIGGYVGAEVGIRQMSVRGTQLLLAVLLLLAGAKLIVAG